MMDGDIKLLMPQNKRFHFRKVNLTAELPSLQKPFYLNADADYKSLRHNLRLSLSTPQLLLFDGKTAKLDMLFQNKFGSKSYKGDISLKEGMPHYHGDVELNILNLPDFLAPFTEINSKNIPIKQMRLDGTATGSAEQNHLKIFIHLSK